MLIRERYRQLDLVDSEFYVLGSIDKLIGNNLYPLVLPIKVHQYL